MRKGDCRRETAKLVMSEDIERHVVRKFEICQRLGKGVSAIIIVVSSFLSSSPYFESVYILQLFFFRTFVYNILTKLSLIRPMALCGKL